MFNSYEKPKEKKRRIISQNVRKGKVAELEAVSYDSIMGGWESKRTGQGHDYKQTRHDWMSGKKEERYKEIKSGNAKLSKLQKKTMEKMKKKGKVYVVDRRDPLFY